MQLLAVDKAKRLRAKAPRSRSIATTGNGQGVIGCAPPKVARGIGGTNKPYIRKQGGEICGARDLGSHKLTFVKVIGHASNPNNEMVHQMAQEAARDL
jgi:hypothetical protein